MQSSESLTRSPTSPPSSSTTTTTNSPHISSPCAACKILRRRCVEQCILAPYFPPSEPQKFIAAHRVFGASNIIKLLQDLPEPQRADAVISLVYEANARTRDPVYGSAGAIFQLQKQLSEVQSQLAMAQAEIFNMQTQQANMAAILCMEMFPSEPSQSSELTGTFTNYSSDVQLGQFHQGSNGVLLEDANVWEPLWT